LLNNSLLNQLLFLQCEKRGLEFDGKLNPWDTRYYSRRLEEEKYAVDKEALKPYFPIAVVTQGLLAIYETLLSLKFTKVSNAPVWHDEVTCVCFRVLFAKFELVFIDQSRKICVCFAV